MAKNNHACMFGWYEHKFTSNKMQKAAEAKGIDSDISLCPLLTQITILQIKM